jgi:hypothetical protein
MKHCLLVVCFGIFVFLNVMTERFSFVNLRITRPCMYREGWLIKSSRILDDLKGVIDSYRR